MLITTYHGVWVSLHQVLVSKHLKTDTKREAVAKEKIYLNITNDTWNPEQKQKWRRGKHNTLIAY